MKNALQLVVICERFCFLTASTIRALEIQFLSFIRILEILYLHNPLLVSITKQNRALI